jgi:TRAP-type C4-dicarboxylate transport system substrate-binding protein
MSKRLNNEAARVGQVRRCRIGRLPDATRPLRIPNFLHDRSARQGDLDGPQLDYSTICANKYYANQRYISDTGHFRDFHVGVANKGMFASLDSIQQKAVHEAAAIAAVRQHTISTEDQAAALAWLKEKAMEFDPLPRHQRRCGGQRPA